MYVARHASCFCGNFYCNDDLPFLPYLIKSKSLPFLQDDILALFYNINVASCSHYSRNATYTDVDFRELSVVYTCGILTFVTSALFV